MNRILTMLYRDPERGIVLCTAAFDDPRGEPGERVVCFNVVRPRPGSWQLQRVSIALNDTTGAGADVEIMGDYTNDFEAAVTDFHRAVIATCDALRKLRGNPEAGSDCIIATRGN